MSRVGVAILPADKVESASQGMLRIAAVWQMIRADVPVVQWRLPFFLNLSPTDMTTQRGFAPLHGATRLGRWKGEF